jgi:hypothetical protein
MPPPPATLEQDIRDALLASKIISYAQVSDIHPHLVCLYLNVLVQGFMLLKQAAVEYKWNLQYGNIALMWRGGCIIRSVFLGNIKEAFDKNPALPNLMLDPWFTNKLRECSAGWRRVVALGALSGIPTPCFSSALSFYDGYRFCKLIFSRTHGPHDPLLLGLQGLQPTSSRPSAITSARTPTSASTGLVTRCRTPTGPAAGEPPPRRPTMRRRFLFQFSGLND